jgi:hypothetical protein
VVVAKTFQAAALTLIGRAVQSRDDRFIAPQNTLQCQRR